MNKAHRVGENKAVTPMVQSVRSICNSLSHFIYHR